MLRQESNTPMGTIKFSTSLASLVVSIWLVGMLSTACHLEAGPPHTQTPNLVLILADDLGYGDLASYGHLIVKTPHIDRLAQEGIRFTQYYAPAPLCSPSRAGLLTGRQPYRTGIRSWIPTGADVHLGRNEITLAHLLQNKGYATAVMGKLHLNGGADLSHHPQASDMGFDYSFVIPGGWAKNKVVEQKPADGSPRRGKLYPDNFWRNGKAVGETHTFSGELVADEAIAWLNEQDRQQPFFLYLPFSEVHTPIASPSKYLKMYDTYTTEFAKNNPDIFHWDWIQQPYRGQGEYYANISFLDAQVGRIIDHLEEMGILDNTIVIFTSDNGPVTREARKPWELNMAGETGGLRGRKDNLLEGGIRVPAIMRYPAWIEPGQVSDEPIYGLDWLPSLVEMMQLDLPADRVIDGQSMLPVLKGEKLQRKKPMIWSIDMAGQDDPINEWAIRQGDWKLILDRAENPKFLFNIANDPYEVQNMMTTQTELVESLREQFRSYKDDIENDSLAHAREK